MDNKSLVLIKNLSIQKGKNLIIKDFSLGINDGDSIALIGANGSGKTTIVEALAGINKKYSGDIVFNSDKYTLPVDFIALQAQDTSMPTAIKVKDIIKLAAKIKNIKFFKNDDELEKIKDKNKKSEIHFEKYVEKYKGKEESLNKIRKSIPIYKPVDLESFLIKYDIKSIYNSYVSVLSGGERQKVNIAITLINNPKVVLFDELTTGVDIKATKNIHDLLLLDEHTSAKLFVSHNSSEIAKLCNRVVFLKDGEKIIDEPIKTIIKKYKSIDKFMESMIGDEK